MRLLSHPPRIHRRLLPPPHHRFRQPNWYALIDVSRFECWIGGLMDALLCHVFSVCGEVEAATEKWRKRQIRREKRSGERLKRRRSKGKELKKTKFALPFYHYRDSESQEMTVRLFQDFSDYMESMTAASSSVDEIVKRISAYLWLTTDGHGVSADRLYDVLIDDSYRSQWYESSPIKRCRSRAHFFMCGVVVSRVCRWSGLRRLRTVDSNPRLAVITIARSLN